MPTATPRQTFLAGVRVLEVSGRASGAYAGRLLALLGADVTKVRLPSLIDVAIEDEAELLAALDEHKSVLADAALVESTRWDLFLTDCPGEEHPDPVARRVVRLVQGQISPEVPVVEIPGRTDGRPTSSMTASAAAGMSWAIGEPGSAPLSLPFDVPEYLAGAEAAAAAAVALIAAPSRPDGQRWTVALTDVVSAYVGQIASNFVPYERPWTRDGARATMSGGSYPAAMFQCADGWMSVMCRTQPEWHGLVRALDRGEWLDDPELRDSRIVARRHADELDPVVAAWCRTRTRDEVFAAGREFGFPVAPVLTIPEVLEQEQLAFRRFFVDTPDGRLRPGSPYRVTEPSPDLLESASARQTRQAGLAPTTTSTRPERPLQGVRVLDLAWVWSGPMVAASLADLGAEVIKVESSTRPDPSRLRGRAVRDGVPLEGPELEVTPYHNQMNRMKKSVEIDITTDRGARLVRELAAESDIVIENMRPGVLARRGLDYASLSRDHPRLVMTSLSMLGQDGPLSGIRGYAVVMSGLAGMDSLIGYDADRLIGTFNPALGDPNGAVHGLAATLAAYRRARSTGVGAWIDVSQVESLVSTLPGPVLAAQKGVVAPPANGHQRFWPHGTFATAGDDQWLSVACRTDAERDALLRWLGAVDETTSRGDVDALLARRLRSMTAVQAAAELHGLTVPAEPVAGYSEQVAASAGICDVVAHPWLGDQPLFGLTWRLDGRRAQVIAAAPTLGQHTVDVLTDVLDLSAAAIDRLVEAEVVSPGGRDVAAQLADA